MKKFSALILAALYLMLTSGVSACFFHCCTDAEAGHVNYGSALSKTDSCDDDHCCNESSEDSAYQIKSQHCSCCNQQNLSVIKENIAASSEFQLEAHQPPLHRLAYYEDFAIQVGTDQFKWPIAKGPPGVSKPFLYILNNSFLI
ncbi:hypothetical protein CKK33_18495 [Mucilaginibacter sp. MD40]|uniref:hypothetical protein n=1 Tax=Mucilaginibacter sp. MD40 TaxID=2029590 RepID=UPI000BACB431|nr:hypothetical protein [Mucilaginibacter sp. MD40]PAW95380.1 hypothetical protein CKK33_18495 [Mucilaginibacter sp. MD40]